MFTIMKQVIDNKVTQKEEGIFKRGLNAFRNWYGKRAWEAEKKAKRIEKAKAALANVLMADMLEAEAEILIESSVHIEDKAQAERMMEEAAAKLAQAEQLRS